MTRQVALGAVVAFIVTVIALSVCQPRAEQAVVAPVAPAAAQQALNPGQPGTIRPELNDVVIARPLIMRDTLARPAFLQKAAVQGDGGAP
ncbi:MAG: hypothetical protein U0228_33945 [Myxococcaceae bacterium]